ncbi:hypothetical protein U9M48_039823 [Paspalum notatum var. saurae]|uniref:Uncharacterized protein n=1 Tax=Paspalum notatum var. saurae TaxID=547442 RepID=A0AAQ3UKD5_PASNO
MADILVLNLFPFLGNDSIMLRHGENVGVMTCSRRMCGTKADNDRWHMSCPTSIKPNKSMIGS